EPQHTIRVGARQHGAQRAARRSLAAARVQVVLVGDPDAVELVVGPVRHDHQVRIERQAMELEEPNTLRPGPAGHAGVDDLESTRRVADAEQGLELAREGCVLVDVEAEGDGIADAENAIYGVVRSTGESLRAAKPLPVVLDRPGR